MRTENRFDVYRYRLRSPISVVLFLIGCFFYSWASADTEPPNAVRLELLCKQIVERDQGVSLVCWIVFFGKSSSLLRVPPGGLHHVADFNEAPEVKTDQSGTTELYPGLPIDRYDSGLSLCYAPESLVAIQHNKRRDGRFEGENFYVASLYLCDARIFHTVLSHGGVLKLTVDLETLEFPIREALPTLDDLLKRFSTKSVEVELDARDLRKLKQRNEKDASEHGSTTPKSGAVTHPRSSKKITPDD
jgi:hypothetical protein